LARRQAGVEETKAERWETKLKDERIHQDRSRRKPAALQMISLGSREEASDLYLARERSVYKGFLGEGGSVRSRNET